jgi:hypothetical protein
MIHPNPARPSLNCAPAIAKATLLLGAVLALDAAAPASAQWVERPYDPAIGSRWIIVTELQRDELDGTVPKTLTYSIKSELTIEGKAAGSFRITYASRDFTIAGNSGDVSGMRTIGNMLKGLVVHATTDASGKPFRVDNIDEVQYTARRMIDATVASEARKEPEREVFRQMLTGFLIVDAERAAGIYLNEVPTLALGQNTGLKPGEERRSSHEIPSPFGGGGWLRSNRTLLITDADAVSGKVRLLQTETYDRGSLEDMLVDIAKRMAPPSGDDPKVTAEKVKQLFESIRMTRDDRTEIEVEDGMTRRLRTEHKSSGSLMGHTYSKHEVKTVTVSPAP